MGMAELVDSPVILVGNIDIGGVFAAIYGTVMLLDENDRKRIKGYIINKFRGDSDLLKPAIEILDKKFKDEGLDINFLGVLPYADLKIEEEDSLSDEDKRVYSDDKKYINISIIKTKKMSNFTDFHPFKQYDDVRVRYVYDIKDLGDEDIIIFPGSKNTIADLEDLKKKGIFEKVSRGVYRFVDNNDNSTLLVKGNGRDLSMINDNSIDCLITDHPYSDKKSNKGGNRSFADYNTFNYEQSDFDEKFRVLKDSAFMVEFFAEENSNNFDYIYKCKKMAEKSGFEYYTTVNWQKGDFVSNTGRKAKNTEQMIFFTKGAPRSLKLDAKKNLKTANENNLDTKGLSSYDVAGKLRENDLTVNYMKGTSKMLPTCFNVDKTPKKGALIIKGIPPIISVLVQGGLIAYALDNNFNVSQLTVFVIGILFIILGNYLPKKEFWGKYNFNLFGLEEGVNEQKVIRAYALLMTFSGVAIFISGFFSSTVALVLIVISAIASTVLPFYLVKKYKA